MYKHFELIFLFFTRSMFKILFGTSFCYQMFLRTCQQQATNIDVLANGSKSKTTNMAESKPRVRTLFHCTCLLELVLSPYEHQVLTPNPTGPQTLLLTRKNKFHLLRLSFVFQQDRSRTTRARDPQYHTFLT